MDRRTAKEFLHLRDWLYRAQGIVEAGKSAYDGDELRQVVIKPTLSPTGIAV
jgi:hypothetical protein